MALILDENGDPWSEEADLLGRLSGDLHCSSCATKIGLSKEYMQRRNCCVCLPCSEKFGWKEPDWHNPVQSKRLVKYYMDGLRRGVL